MLVVSDQVTRKQDTADVLIVVANNILFKTVFLSFKSK